MPAGLRRRATVGLVTAAVLSGGILTGCGQSGRHPAPSASETAPSASGTTPSVGASVETELFPGASGDVADDAAIWRDPQHPERSLVLADDKSEHGGVAVFDLSGRLRHYERAGMIGNIDLRTDVPVGDRTVTLVGANDRTDDTIRLWSLDPAGPAIVPLEAAPLRTR